MRCHSARRSTRVSAASAQRTRRDAISIRWRKSMKSLWNDAEAARFDGDLGLRVYTSQLLGRDHTLVLHGGGNTSVKVRERLVTGEELDVLYVKGSGWDLETIKAPGFAPVRLNHLRR